jgi:hypothetical protein
VQEERQPLETSTISTTGLVLMLGSSVFSTLFPSRTESLSPLIDASATLTTWSTASGPIRDALGLILATVSGWAFAKQPATIRGLPYIERAVILVIMRLAVGVLTVQVLISRRSASSGLPTSS